MPDPGATFQRRGGCRARRYWVRVRSGVRKMKHKRKARQKKGSQGADAKLEDDIEMGVSISTLGFRSIPSRAERACGARYVHDGEMLGHNNIFLLLLPRRYCHLYLREKNMYFDYLSHKTVGQ